MQHTEMIQELWPGPVSISSIDRRANPPWRQALFGGPPSVLRVCLFIHLPLNLRKLFHKQLLWLFSKLVYAYYRF